MHTRIKLAMTSLTVLWMFTSVFGGLTFLAAPSQPAAPTHSQMLDAHPRMP